MIGKITKGSSGRALIRYLFGPGKTNEHTDQRVVASGLAVGIEEGRLLSAAEIAGLGAAIDSANDRFGANPLGGHIWHVSLSIPRADRLVDDEWADMAQRVMSALGFERQGVQPAPWVAIGHGTSAAGNQHLHIAASLVRMDGRQVNIWQDRKTLSEICAEIEHTYGLTVVEGREGRGIPGLSRAELERTAREHLPEAPRVTLARLVREASVASKDEAEFVRRLRGSGALVRPRFETGGKRAVVGYSVALRTRAGDTPIWFGGGKLAKDLTLPHLRQFWEVSKDDQRSAVAEWCTAKSVVPPAGRLSVVTQTTGDGRWQVSRVRSSACEPSRYLISPPGVGQLGKPPECSPPGRDAWKGTVQDLWRQQQMLWLDRRRADPVSPPRSAKWCETSEE